MWSVVATLSLALLTSLCSAKEAIVLGSSGLVGSLAVQEFLASDEWTDLYLVVRKPISDDLRGNPKVHEIIVPDLAQMASDPGMKELASQKKGAIDAAIVTIGVNMVFGWKLQKLVDVEYELTKIFSTFCHENLGIKYIGVLTMAGTEREKPFTPEELEADITHWNVFDRGPRVKGMIENEVLSSGIPYTSFFRPANFETDEYRFGALDVVAQAMCSILNFVLPTEWHSIHVKDIARGIFEDASQATSEIAQSQSDAFAKKERVLLYDDLMRRSNGDSVPPPNAEL